jgi:hypothetical protein
VVAHTVPIVTGARSVQQLRPSSEIENLYRKGLRHSTRPLRAFSRLAPAWSAPRWLRSKNVIDSRSGGNRRSASAPDETRQAQRPPRPHITCSALRCRPNPRVKSLVRIGVSKTGFTRFSTPSCARTRREIATITASTTSLRHMVFNLMQRDRSRVSLRSKFNLAAWKGGVLGRAAFHQFEKAALMQNLG